MPLVRKWRRLGLAGQLAVLLSTSVVIIGALVVAIAAVISSQNAGREAKGAVSCVNHILLKRNPLQTQDSDAHIAFAKADEDYDTALVAVLVAPQEAKPAAFRLFIAAAQAKAVADDKYVHALSATDAARRADPLGRC